MDDMHENYADQNRNRTVFIIGPDELYSEEGESDPQLEEIAIELETYGFEVLTPYGMTDGVYYKTMECWRKLSLHGVPEKEWRQVMILQICQLGITLSGCVYLMPGWKQSAMSIMLLHFAHAFGKPILVRGDGDYPWLGCYPIHGIDVAVSSGFDSSESLAKIDIQEAADNQVSILGLSPSEPGQKNDELAAWFKNQIGDNPRETDDG